MRRATYCDTQWSVWFCQFGVKPETSPWSVGQKWYCESKHSRLPVTSRSRPPTLDLSGMFVVSLPFFLLTFSIFSGIRAIQHIQRFLWGSTGQSPNSRFPCWVFKPHFTSRAILKSEAVGVLDGLWPDRPIVTTRKPKPCFRHRISLECRKGNEDGEKLVAHDYKK